MADLYLRFVYVIWFLTYFSVSNLRLESYENLVPPDEHLKFDLVQCVASLAALFCLDFFGSKGFAIGSSYRGAIFAANMAVGIICVSALVLLKNDRAPQLTRQRWYALAIAVVSIGVTRLPNSIASWFVWFALAIGLFYPLFKFITHRFQSAALSKTSARIQPVTQAKQG